jgi:hypothetical protein
MTIETDAAIDAPAPASQHQLPGGQPVRAQRRGRTTARDAEQVFTTSILVSATRCLLTYVVLPFVAPAIGLAAAVGPWLGITLSGVGIVANGVSVRRFWLVGHRWRVHYTVVATAVIVLLLSLIVADVAELARR